MNVMLKAANNARAMTNYPQLCGLCVPLADMTDARRPPRQRAAEQRKRDNNPSDVHERQRVDIPDRQNDRATAAKMSGTRDILGREGGGAKGGQRSGGKTIM